MSVRKRRLILMDSDSDEPPPSPVRKKTGAGEVLGEVAALDEVKSVNKMVTLGSEAKLPQEDEKAEDSTVSLVSDCAIRSADGAGEAVVMKEVVKAEEDQMNSGSDSLRKGSGSVTAVVEAAVPQEEVKADGKMDLGTDSLQKVNGSVEGNVPQEEVKSEVGKMGLSSDAVEGREEAGVLKQKGVEEAKVKERVKEPSSDKKKMEKRREQEKQRGLVTSSGKQREELGTSKKKFVEGKKNFVENKDNGKERLKLDRPRVGGLDDGKKRDEASRFKEKYEEYKKKSLDNRDTSKMVKVEKQNTSKQREDSAFKKKSEEEIKAEKKKFGRLPAAKSRPEIPTFMKKVLQNSTRVEDPKARSRPEFKVGKKRLLSPNTRKRRGEVYSGKKKATEVRSDEEELRSDRRRASIAGTFEKIDGVVTVKKKVAYPNSDQGVDRRELAARSEKKATELLDHKLERKRTREVSDVDTSLKRSKPELESWQGETKKADGQKMKSASKSVAPSGEQTDGLNEKSPLAKLRTTFMPKAEKEGGSDSVGKRTPQKLKENTVQSIGTKREASDIIWDRSTRLQSKGSNDSGQLNNNELPHLKVNVRREDAEETDSSSSTSYPSNCSTPVHPDDPTDETCFVKPISRVGKVQDMSNSLDEKHKFNESKRKLRSSSVEVKNKVPSGRKANKLRKGEDNSSSKTPSSTNKPKKATEGLRSVKKKITDQIKGVLLDAGWKIDLRPRRGRDYQDQVYIPPTGGSGYWSITKAYAAFQKLSSPAIDGKKNRLSDKSPKKSTGSDTKLNGVGSSSVISDELLSMLKRNIVNKRRNKTSKDYSDTKNPSGKINTRHRGRGLLVRGSKKEAETGDDDYVPYVWKRTVFSWMIDLGIVSLNGKVNYMNKRRTHSILEGQIVRDGIQCSCCSKIITVSKFESHAGSKLQKPYENIFVEESGISLLQCQLDAWEKQDKSERQGFYTVNIEGDPNDDACGLCGNGGDLICCDGCPSTFHQSCLGIEELPLGDWHCTYCSCRFCGFVSESSVEGSELRDSPLFSCKQCEKRYHQGCIPVEDAVSTISNNSGDAFCGKSCRKVFRQLQKLLGIKNDLEAGLSWRLIRRLDDDSGVLSTGLSMRAECNSKIAIALAVMDECFLPIIDQSSCINLIHNVVYNCGSNFNRLNCSGFYTFTLERGDEIICVASVRVHGTRLAEMPFIGTRNRYRRQGMCRRLLDQIESALRSLRVEKLIIPAISELKDAWTTVFGFKPLGISEKEEVKSMNILVFPDTGLLEKRLLNVNSSKRAEADKIVPRVEKHEILKVQPDASVFSSVGPNPNVSGEGIVHYEDHVKDIKCSSPALDVCIPSSVTRVPESSKISLLQASEKKSAERATDPEVFTLRGEVCHEELVGGDSHQVSSELAAKFILPSLDTSNGKEDLIVDNYEHSELKNLVESNNHDSDKAGITIHEVRRETAAVKSEPNANAEDVEPQNLTPASTALTCPPEVSEAEKPLQQSSKAVAELSESPDVVLHDNEHNSVPVAAHNGHSGNASAAPDACPISTLTRHHSAMGIDELDASCETNDSAQALTQDKGFVSTSAMVQHDVNGANQGTYKIPLEPRDICSEGTSDTGTEFAFIQTTYGPSSFNCTSKVVTTSLDKGSQSVDGSPENGT